MPPSLKCPRESVRPTLGLDSGVPVSLFHLLHKYSAGCEQECPPLMRQSEGPEQREGREWRYLLNDMKPGIEFSINHSGCMDLKSPPTPAVPISLVGLKVSLPHKGAVIDFTETSKALCKMKCLL